MFLLNYNSRYIWIVLLQRAGCSPMSQTQNSLFKNYTLCSDLPSCFTQGQVSHALVKVMLCNINNSSWPGLVVLNNEYCKPTNQFSSSCCTQG